MRRLLPSVTEINVGVAKHCTKDWRDVRVVALVEAALK